MEDALKALFQAHFGEAPESSGLLKGDGSNRKLFRLRSKERSAVGVFNTDRKENAAFLEFSRHFRKTGLPVPEIYAQDLEKGMYLEEDLGDTTLFQYISDNRTEENLGKAATQIYHQIVQILPQFQILAGRELDYRFCYPRSNFDKQSMMWDLNHFKYYFLRLAYIPFNEQELEEDFQHFSDFLLTTERDFFMYRDFQSRNIMIQGGRPYFIDYQGGRKGALQYDIASLLFDAKADLPLDLREDLLQRYLEAAGRWFKVERKQFMRYYYGYAIIRILQAFGTYGLRGFYERKGHFLQSIPYAIRNLEFLLRTVELPVKLPALMQVLRRIVASSSLRKISGVTLKLTVRIQSFSYRDGIPNDEKGHGGGYVFDCRALPNPAQEEGFAKRTGKDPEVAAFLDKQPGFQRFMAHIYGLIDQSVESYRNRNFTDLMVAFGCTGGRHRSVYCAELLAKHLREKQGVDVEIRHREQEKTAGLVEE